MKELILIDLSSIWWSNWHATADQDVSSAYENTVGRVRRIAENQRHVGICLDSPPYWRKQILPTYKAQRDAPPEVAVDQFRRVRERLEADGFTLLSAPGYEADDVIATAVKLGSGYDRIVIWTGDKDLAQLVTDRVHIVSVQKNERSGPEEIRAKFGVGPQLIRDLLALTGDKSDNIQGVNGVGLKRAADLLNKFGDLDVIQSIISDGDPDNELGTPAIRNALLAAGETIEIARKLVSLKSDAPIDIAPLEAQRTEKPLVPTQDFEDAEFEEPSDVRAAPAPVTAGPSVAKTAPVPRNEPAIVTTGTAVSEPTGAIAHVKPEWALEPVSAGQAIKLAERMVNSRLFGNITNPDAALGMILKGRTMGIDAVTSLTAFHLIEGRLCLTAQTIVALIKSNRLCQFFECLDTSDKVATWETHRTGDRRPMKLTWTIDDAIRAGLVREPAQGKKAGPWITQPRTMLRWRAATELARIVYPDLLSGIYSTEEMRDARESEAA